MERLPLKTPSLTQKYNAILKAMRLIITDTFKYRIRKLMQFSIKNLAQS